MKTKMVDQTGKDSGEATLPESVFGVAIREHLMFDVVNAQRAGWRQGTAKVKERSEVRGGGKKPFRQKGTGSARQGSNRSPLMPGGGTIFGPRPRDFSQSLPKKVRQEALRVALSQAQSGGKVFVVKDFSFEKPKTKAVRSLLEQLKVEKALFVDSGNENLGKSVRNLPKAKYLDERVLNVFDILKYDNVVMSSKALEQVEKRLGK